MYCAPRDATITQVDMPPIGAQGQAIEPFRAVNNAVGPFISGFRFQVRISGNAFFYLILCLRGERISYGREALCAGRRELRQCWRMKGFRVAAAQSHTAYVLGINWLPADRDLRFLCIIRGVCCWLVRLA